MEELPADSLRCCQCMQWYSKFSTVTHRTEFVALSDADEAYLLSDAISAADIPDAVPNGGATRPDYCSDSDSSDGAPAAPRFPQLADLRRRINACIDALGGEVLPKLNWSAPRDATWISPSGLCCRNADEVLLLLKSSDRAAHDAETVASLRLQAPGSSTAAPAGSDACHGWPLVISMRRFFHLRPEREFRCFVRRRRLVAACQRDPTQHFPAALDARDTTLALLQAFFSGHVAAHFPQESYTFDVYVTAKQTVRLLDFNPVRWTTQALLFEWSELGLDAGGQGGTDEAAPCQLRLVEDEGHIQAGAGTAYNAPLDVVDMHGMGWADVIGHLERQTIARSSDV